MASHQASSIKMNTITPTNFLVSLSTTFREFSKHGDWLSLDETVSALHSLELKLTYGQVVELVVAAGKCNDRSRSDILLPGEPSLLYGEFCWYAAQFIQAFKRIRREGCASSDRILKVTAKSQKPCEHNVFLGGACNPTVWRSYIAIPYLIKHKITYYNPQVAEWHYGLIAEERKAKSEARVTLLVIDEETRGVSSLVEAAFLCASGTGVIPVIRLATKKPPSAAGGSDHLQLTENELSELNYARGALIDYAERRGVLVFSDLNRALETARSVLLPESAGEVVHRVASWAESCERLGDTITRAQSAFTEAAGTATGGAGSARVGGQGDNGVLGISGEKAKKLVLELVPSMNQIGDTVIPMSIVSYNEFLSLAALTIFKAKEQETENDNKKKKATLADRKDQVQRALREMFKWLTNVTFQQAGQWGRQCSPAEEAPLVYLGGSCGSSTWRDDIAIPCLERAGITYHNPQAAPGTWALKQIPCEISQINNFKVLLFYISPTTRSVASLVDAAYHIGDGVQNILICIKDIQADTMVCGEFITAAGLKDYNRGRDYLRDVCKEKNIPMYTNISRAVRSCVSLLKHTAVSAC